MVVHFAAEAHNDNSLAHPESFVQSNIVGTFAVIDVAREHDVRLHHISTDEFYGDLPLNDFRRFSGGTPKR